MHDNHETLKSFSKKIYFHIHLSGLKRHLAKFKVTWIISVKWGTRNPTGGDAWFVSLLPIDQCSQFFSLTAFILIRHRQ